MNTCELVKETVEFYSNPENRAMKDTKCMYEAPNGNHCAIGRLIDEEKLKSHGITFEILDELGDYSNVSNYLECEYDIIFKDLLIDEVQNINEEVFIKLQKFHDDETEEIRKLKAAKIIEDYCK